MAMEKSAQVNGGIFGYLSCERRQQRTIQPYQAIVLNWLALTVLSELLLRLRTRSVCRSRHIEHSGIGTIRNMNMNLFFLNVCSEIVERHFFLGLHIWLAVFENR